MNPEFGTNQCVVPKLLAAGSAAGLFWLIESPATRAEKYETPAYAKAMTLVKMRSFRAIPTEPGLYGPGCATFTQPAQLVVTAIDKYLNSLCMGGKSITLGTSGMQSKSVFNSETAV